MQQVQTYAAGERDYANIRGDTGPLVYPAGFLYCFRALRSVVGLSVMNSKSAKEAGASYTSAEELDALDEENYQRR